jgi:XTP/dITP diphosphohydrolase
MPRRFTGGKLVVASHNAGKVREIRDLLAPFNAEVVSAGELGLPEPEETGLTFIANAELKALSASLGANVIALADDSGLAVDGLNGAPGIYSARWAGPTKDFNLAMKKIENALGQNPDRNAQFICALSLAWPDGHCDTFEGKVAGKLTFPPRGSEGFGYDPIFIPEGFDITFGEMDPAKKHEMSHRANAFRQLVAACFS